MLKVLSNTSFISARILAEELRNLGEQCISTRRTERINRGDYVIRYGSTSLHEGIDTLNSLEVIRTCSNKLSFSNMMRENNIYTPVFSRGSPSHFPIIVRTTLNSFGGRGMILVNNAKDFHYENAYWTPYIATDFELRVHVLGGKIIRVFRKEGGENYIRTSSNGWHFSLRENETYPKVNSVVKKIFSTPMFSNCFMALDLGWDSSVKEYVVFEGNSAPGLNEHTANLYAEYILNKIKTIYR
jgi:hypothetical protein